MQINAKSTTTKVVAAGMLVAGTWGVTTFSANADGADRAGGPAPEASSSAAPSAAAKSKTPKWAYMQKVFTSPAGSVTSGASMCPDQRYKVTGGGVRTTSDDQFVNETAPLDGADKGHKPDDGWTVYVGNEDTSDHDFIVWAICKR